MNKKVKTKREKPIYLENQEMFQRNLISQIHKVIHQADMTLIIRVSILILIMTWRPLIRKPFNFTKKNIFIETHWSLS